MTQITFSDAELSRLLLYAAGYIEQHSTLYEGPRRKERRDLLNRLYAAARSRQPA